MDGSDFAMYCMEENMDEYAAEDAFWDRVHEGDLSESDYEDFVSAFGD